MHRQPSSDEPPLAPIALATAHEPSTLNHDELSAINNPASAGSTMSQDEPSTTNDSAMNHEPLTMNYSEPLTIAQKKDWAKLLYTTDTRITIPEIAARVNLPEEILNDWVKDEGLEAMRYGELAGRDRQLRNLYSQLNALNEAINQKPYGARYPDSKQADVLSKISSSIKGLESEVNLAALLEAGKGFLNHVRVKDFDNLQLCASLFDSYVQKLVKQ